MTMSVDTADEESPDLTPEPFLVVLRRVFAETFEISGQVDQLHHQPVQGNDAASPSDDGVQKGSARGPI